ncbi:MAG: hypothetical protein ABJF10_07765 [Chthoniobacter sp.]|uniref:hypothetical protein n=1 Tax=Chthoniobacter sp. TaxID=2510640 RepID=UPI0032A9A13F
MLEHFFSVLLLIAAVYLGCGALVAAFFFVGWCRRFDPSAREGSWGFRVLIAPGVVALWPVILAKVVRLQRNQKVEGEAETPISPEALRRNHALAFVVLAILAPVIFAVVLASRAPRWQDAPPVEVVTKLTLR